MSIHEQIVSIVQENLPEFKNEKLEVRLSNEINGREDGRDVILSPGSYYNKKNAKARLNHDTGPVIIVNTNSMTHYSPSLILSLNSMMGEFLEGIGLSVNDMTCFLFVLLHEYGHADHYRIYKERKETRKFIMIDENNKNSVGLAYTQSEIIDSTRGVSVYNSLRIGELYANNYAMKKFVPMWNKIKQTVLSNNH